MEEPKEGPLVLHCRPGHLYYSQIATVSSKLKMRRSKFSKSAATASTGVRALARLLPARVHAPSPVFVCSLQRPFRTLAAGDAQPSGHPHSNNKEHS